MSTYLDHIRPHLGAAGQLNDFIELRDGRVVFAGELDLLALVERYGAPLEVSFCPLIARRVREMHAHFAAARARAGYGGGFVYAYATKANFAEEVVRTAVAAGAHYETSSAFDVRIAHQLWRNGVLPPERFIFCNGSKEANYIQAILELRGAGFANVVPILDDLDEFEALSACREPLLLGVRERKDAGDMAEGMTYGYDRFGMLPDELEQLAASVAQTPHRIVLYHAMVGSQLEDREFWTREICESLDGFARLRALAPDLAEGATYGYDRFGMLPEEMETLAKQVTQTPHRLILYHAMVGSQLEDRAFWLDEIRESLAGYARLRAVAPDLNYFNFGGGMPTGAYSLDFAFDYAAAAEELLRTIGGCCDEHSVPHTHLVGEFGRYTVADHGVHIFRVGRIKTGHPGMPPWYLLDGSLMVALPDILIVDDQQFITLPLNHLHAEASPVVLGGRRTCDSDDFYPRAGEPPLILPLVGVEDTETRKQRDKEFVSGQLPLSPALPVSWSSSPLLIAFFGTGAYQAMLSGEGGAHHCLAPEAPKLIVEARDGALVSRLIGEQSWEDVLGELGYS